MRMRMRMRMKMMARVIAREKSWEMGESRILSPAGVARQQQG